MNEENKQTNKKRGFGRAVLPYILIALAIGAFIALIVSAASGKTKTWSSDSLVKEFEKNQIVTAEVYDKDMVVTVSGIAIDESNNEFKYTFTVNAHDYYGDIVTDPPTVSYLDLLKKEIKDYQDSFFIMNSSACNKIFRKSKKRSSTSIDNF